MAEKPEAPEAAPKSKSRLPLTLGLVLGVAVVEAIAFIAIFKFAGSGPEAAHGENAPVIEPVAETQPTATAEVAVLNRCRVPNDKTGRLYLYDFDVAVVVPLDKKEWMEELVKSRGSEIGDRIARILRGATDRMLKEDDLRALRQQMLEGLQEVVEDDQVIQRVLIPRFVPMRSD